MKRRLLALFVLTGLVAAGAGWLVRQALLAPESQAAEIAPAGQAEDLVGSARPPFTLGGIDGNRVSASDFDGQVVLINFWATWCAPCREEMPMLAGLHERFSGQGFQVIGIAMDDVQQARDFVSEIGIAYPVLVGMTDVMATSLAYGNRAGYLPYSVLVGRDGVVRWTQLGVVDEADIAERIQTLL